MSVFDKITDLIAEELEEVPKLLEPVVYGSKGGRPGSLTRCYVAMNYLKEFEQQLMSKMKKEEVDTAKEIASCIIFNASIQGD